MLSKNVIRGLFAAAAAAPLCLAASQALAQTTITTATTTPQRTSETGDLAINAGGLVTVVDGGAAVIVDSDNNVTTTGGAISVRDSAPGGTGILVDTNGGRTATITIGGNIAADETPADDLDTDDDGDLDGPLVTPGSRRYGIRVVGDSPLIGDIIHTGGVIAVDGEDGSAAISIETGLDGDLIIRGAAGAQGNNSYGVYIGGPVSGEVRLGGAIQGQGEGSVAVRIDGPVQETVTIDGEIIASGFRYTNRNTLPTEVENLDADDLLIGGSAIQVTSSLSRGLVVEFPPVNNDPEDLDEDDDGIPDANETAGDVTSFGSAPAIMIGGASDIALGNVGAAERDAFGFIIRGRVTGDGVYDGISATGAQLGGAGGAVDTGSGVSVTGTLRASAFNADVQGLVLADGAVVPVLSVLDGQISAGVNTDDTIAPNSTAVRVMEGASLTSVINSGLIRAGVLGPAGNATAIADESGDLTSVTNTGTISATVASLDPDEVVTGEAVALDLRNNTTGVAVVQNESETENFVESITGDILFGTGAGNDSLTVNAGRTIGAVSFGGGADTLSISGEETVVRADLSKGAGSLDIDLADGRLVLTNLNQVNATSLDVMEGSILTFTADPQNGGPLGQASFLNVNGQATFAQDTRIGLEFLSKIDGPTTYTLLSADSLINNGVDTSLAGELPILFIGNLSIIGNDVEIAVRRATTDELGLTGNSAQMFEAFYAAFDADPRVAAQFFGKDTVADFGQLYQQFLPDYSGGPFRALSTTTRAAMAAQAEQGAGLIPNEPRSWLQEVGATVKQETVNDVPYETGGFGIVGGVERPFRGEGSFIGVSGSYQSSEIRNGNRAVGSYLSASTLAGSIYWRRAQGNLVLDSSLTGGFAWFDSVRRIADVGPGGAQLLIRQAEADWNGLLAGARVGAAYNWESGRFYARPEVILDAIYLSERGYTETGGGGSVDLAVGSRSNYEAAAEAGVLVGAKFGRTFRWGPELRVGYRAVLASGDGETSGAFVSAPGTPFAIPGLGEQDGLLIVRAALRGHGAYSNFAIEAGGDIGEDYHAYTMRLLVRFLF